MSKTEMQKTHRCRMRWSLSAAGTFLIILWLMRLLPLKLGQFVYHPLYQLLDGDIAGLRQANMLMTFALGWGVCILFSCLTRRRPKRESNNATSDFSRVGPHAL